VEGWRLVGVEKVPAHTSVLDFWPPELREYNPVVPSPLVLLRQPRETDTPSFSAGKYKHGPFFFLVF
jgi:hypothetical protein